MRSFCLNGQARHRPFTYAAHLRTHVDYAITGAQAAGPHVFAATAVTPPPPPPHRRPFFHPRTVILPRPAVCANSAYKTRTVNLPATIRAVFVVDVLSLSLSLPPSPLLLLPLSLSLPLSTNLPTTKSRGGKSSSERIRILPEPEIGT